MACTSCGKSANTHVGTTLNTAIVLGEPTPDVYRARVSGQLGSLQLGAIKYFRGSLVDQYVEEGKLIILAGGARTLPTPRPGTAIYYVGEIGYTSLPAARVRSGQTGEEIVVRTLG